MFCAIEDYNLQLELLFNNPVDGGEKFGGNYRFFL